MGPFSLICNGVGVTVVLAWCRMTFILVKLLAGILLADFFIFAKAATSDALMQIGDELSNRWYAVRK
jgi:hypothetical protein